MLNPRPTRWLALLSLVPLAAVAQPERLVQLEPDAAAARMAEIRSHWGSRDEFLARADVVRGHLAATLDLPTVGASGVDPDADARGPLDPLVHQSRVYEHYVVDDVSFRAFPGCRVTANVYRPRRSRGLHAAVLCVHGHFGATDSDPEGRFRRDMQLRCASLARMGAVVMAYDMVGWGESGLSGHDTAASLPLQTFNSVRAVDYLLSRADVDAARLAITGASGGGSQSFILAALDQRVTSSVPAVMVSSHFFGGCMCETGLPLHSGEGFATNNVEIAALAAPRPQLLISCGSDWTANTPEIEFPSVRAAYATLGAADALQNAHFADQGHDYGPSKRLALYRFAATHLSLDLDEVVSEDGSIREGFVTIESKRDLLSYDDAERPARLDAVAALAELRSP